MTLTELKYIIALAREKHFGKAAQICHVSQPTLSVAIQKLESELGVAIFERLPNSIHVTEVGEKIVAQAYRVVEESEAIKKIAQSKKSQLDTPLRLGAIFTVGPYLFPSIIPKLIKLAPNMPLYIQEDFTANLRKKLHQGELDVIVIALPFTEPGVVTHPLYDEPFVALMHKEHKLSKKKTIQIGDLENEEILLLGEGHCFRDQVLEVCAKCMSKAKQKMVEGTSLETLRHMVASGFGITILPITATQIQHYQSILCTKPFKEKTPQRHIALAWRSSFTRPQAIDVLIKALSASSLRGICLI